MRAAARIAQGFLARPARVALLAFLVAGVIGICVCADAAADEHAAAARFFATLHRFHQDTAVQADAVVDGRTLVDGVYRLEERGTGRFLALITESGDVIGDGQGWRWIDAEGFRPLAEAEAGRLRGEILGAIDWRRLVEVRYGRGGGRRILLVSAVDCPVCARMEAGLAERAGTLDTSFRLLPMSLSPGTDSEAGAAGWDKAARIWCAADGAAWRAYWSARTLPPRDACPIDGPQALRLARNLATVLSSIGVPVRGTPTMIREDGSVLRLPRDADDSFYIDELGPAGLRAAAGPTAGAHRRWLDAPG